MNKINIGVLGCADVANRHVIPAIKGLPDCYHLTGIASRTESKAKIFSEKFNTEAFSKYEDLLNIEDLDAVYIPLPNSLHYTWIKKSLQKGLHVLVEKSLACSYEDVVELNNLAQEKNLLLVENFQFRFHSQLRYIKGIVRKGKIGELRSVRSSFGFPPFRDNENIRYKKELGGGALLDAGAYTLKVSQMFLGNDIYVASASLFENKQIGVDIWGSAYIKQKNGSLTSHAAFGFDHFYQCSIDLWGSRGRIYTNRIFTSPPGYRPIVELETMDGKEMIELEPDHHFKNLLVYFHSKISNKANFENEYQKNINQSRLLNELRDKAGE